jgi:hypothetical protein
VGYALSMMNDLLPTLEETATPDILAEIEHKEWLRDEERRERWAELEARLGPLLTPREWNSHQSDFNYWLDHREEFGGHPEGR